jgi:hypothetical protein
MSVECATSLKIGLCDDKKCKAIHIQLFDERGECYAYGTLGVEHVPIFTKRMQDLAYEVAATKDE